MQSVANRAARLFAALVLLMAMAVPAAAQRSITLLPDTDLPGLDYGVVKDVSLDACEAACAGDRACRAFTFNDKAKWCFLKSGLPDPVMFAGATSGSVEISPSAATTAAIRQAELPFPGQYLFDEARVFAAALPQTDAPPANATYAGLLETADAAAAASNPSAALIAYRQALAINANDPTVWLKLATVSLIRAGAVAESTPSDVNGLAVVATSAVLNAFLRAETRQERALALGALAQALEFRQMWRESIASYRASIALVDDLDLQARLDAVVAQHGFRIVSHEVDSEPASPRICIVFSEQLPASGVDLSQYVSVAGTSRIAVETEDRQVCITGVEHGSRYAIAVRSGLPSANSSESLQKDVALDVYVPDRSPFVAFANSAYVLPAGLGSGLPISAVNAEAADIVIYRIGDRSIATAVRDGIFNRALDGYSAEDIASRSGELSFKGQVELAGGASANVMTTTAIPVAEVLTDLRPGAYVITAKVAGVEAEYWNELATQWFIVTDLGLTTVSGDDGLHAFVRALSSAAPVAGAAVKLVAVNNEILGEGVTGDDGRVQFAPGLIRGTGGRAPQLLAVETDAGDYAFLDVAKPAFDLTDRGVEGRPAPGPLDLFATTERGVYRPSETVFLTALLRDPQANAVENLALTLEIERPDGVVAQTDVLQDGGAGGYHLGYTLAPEAMRGSWTVRFYADRRDRALGSVNFLVEDFEPERLAFEIMAADEPIAAGEVFPIDVAAKYLYGATAPGLGIEGDAVIRPSFSLAGFPGYSFGRRDDTFETFREPLGTIGVTDETGAASAEVVLPELGGTTRPLDAQLILRLVDTNGRTVERSLSRPVLAVTDRVGVRPQWDRSAGLAEGTEASFDVIAVTPDGEMTDKPGLEWRLSRIETTYQWYRINGAWRWEAITTTREVANGTVDATVSEAATISSPVGWGRYVLEVGSTGPDATSTSYEFYAGYYYADAGSDTPDVLQVALDKTAYRVGETANLRLDPQFAGTALVMVVDGRVIDMQAVEVPAEGTTVPLTVTEQWGPGAYVTAVLYRPADAAEKRVPARALGLAFADVDPGDKLLEMRIDAPGVTLPRQPFEVTVELGNVAAGETAYVAVAAVDLGILNLTNFQVPDPDGWFFGQRRLGVEFRDLYGQLIDPTQGIPGAIRSGGDGGGSRTGTPPPTSVLVALHSGIVEVGPDGTATVSFDMPDFNGTVRVMAMAWTESALGHASADVVVRDPVVVNMSPPRFLRLDDESRLLVEINNLEGAAGTYTVALDTGPGLATSAATSTVELETGDRATLNLGLTGTQIGDQSLTLTVTPPEGDPLIKDLVLGVRAASAPQTSSVLIEIAPGTSVELDASYFGGMVPHTGQLTLAVGPIARLDVPTLLLSLDRYPYGCAEQVSSRAFPLLYLNEVAEMVGMGTDAAIDQRIRDAIADILSKQTSAGGFGLWGPFSGSDMWLDAYVTEFLLRARAEGYEVPELAIGRALDSLGNQVSYASDFDQGGEDVAYALYALARAGRAAIGDLRYYAEARIDNFGSPLAKAQIGAALALYGDRTRAAAAFAKAVAGLDAPEDRRRWRTDYGSRLRDTAAVLALAAEFTPAGVDVAALATKLADRRDAQRWTSTQEDAWTLIAASALAREAASGWITIDGETVDGSVYRLFDQALIEGGAVTVANAGNTATEMKVSVTGIPATPPPATSEGFTITRDYYTPDGTWIESLGEVAQNDRFVVVLSVTSEELGSGQYIVADPLPAGFEIENPNLAAGSGVADLGWLDFSTMPIHVESRTDQFVAAFRYWSEQKTFTAAYLVRAVSPGTFVLPGATVEDMYRPERRANTASEEIVIAPTGGPPAGAAELVVRQVTTIPVTAGGALPEGGLAPASRAAVGEGRAKEMRKQ